MVKSMKILLFEDEFTENLYPITYTRASFEIRIGLKNMVEKIYDQLKPEKIYILCRDYIREVVCKKYPYTIPWDGSTIDDILIINGLLCLGERELKEIMKIISTKDSVLISNGRIVAAHISENILKKNVLEKIHDIKKIQNLLETFRSDSVRIISYPWQLVKYSLEVFVEEFNSYSQDSSNLGDNVYVRGSRDNVKIDENTYIEPSVLIDVRKGPVYIGRNVEVEYQSRIAGPAYIGRDSIIYGARIESSIIGEVCRIGGEVVNSVISRYSNKRHFGFLGHSFIGEWVNLGAGFTNSNLKNTYGTVKMKIGDKLIDTGETFVGCFIGDHVRASIGTLLYTGKKIGVASQIHGIVVRDVPCFTFYAKSLGVEIIELEFEDVLKSISRMMARRNIELSEAEVSLLRKVYELSREERVKEGVKKERIKIE
ncbi:MAG: putative sugar nucleotidyl transferase [Nitrososphaerota archaeon]